MKSTEIKVTVGTGKEKIEVIVPDHIPLKKVKRLLDVVPGTLSRCRASKGVPTLMEDK